MSLHRSPSPDGIVGESADVIIALLAVYLNQMIRHKYPTDSSTIRCMLKLLSFKIDDKLKKWDKTLENNQRKLNEI